MAFNKGIVRKVGIAMVVLIIAFFGWETVKSENRNNAIEKSFSQLKQGQNPDQVFAELKEGLNSNKGLSFKVGRNSSKASNDGDKTAVCAALAGIVSNSLSSGDLGQSRAAYQRAEDLNCGWHAHYFCEDVEAGLIVLAQRGDWDNFDELAEDYDNECADSDDGGGFNLYE